MAQEAIQKAGMPLGPGKGLAGLSGGPGWLPEPGKIGNLWREE
jgi:hypothetical protein